MRSFIVLLSVFLTALALSACGSGNSTPNIALPTTALPYIRAAGNNVLSVQVGGLSVCGQSGYLNEPCTSVTICMPGTQQCKTVTDILVDTGSVGLRVFASALPFTLPNTTDGSGNEIAECAQFGIGSDWGPVASADVILAGESPVNVPVQVINKAYSKLPTDCAAADASPAAAGFNGILGVGPFTEDCGAACAASSALHAFFSCSSSGSAGCTPVALAASKQPQNVIAKLPADNNGILLALNQVSLGGTNEVAGALILGIDTQANNHPQGVSAYNLDTQGNFTTLFQNGTFPGSFIDSGSNGVYFPNVPNIAICGQDSPAAGFYCPSQDQVFTATNVAASGGAKASVQFPVGNASQLAQGNAVALLELAGPSDSTFDWGLPFFYGRAVFVGIEGKSSSLGSGRYIAY